MKILAFDTATEACSVALNIDGEVFQRFEVAPRLHTSYLLPMIEYVLAEGQLTLNQLDAVAFGRGPGMFTGVRIAVAAAQALGFGVDVPVIPVSSLEALALSAHQQFGFTEILAALDARMGQVYAGVFRFESMHLNVVTDEALVDLSQLQKMAIGGYGVGSGCEIFQSELSQLIAVQSGCYPQATAVTYLAAEMLLQGKSLPPELALPVYMRDKVT